MVIFNTLWVISSCLLIIFFFDIFMTIVLPFLFCHIWDSLSMSITTLHIKRKINVCHVLTASVIKHSKQMFPKSHNWYFYCNRKLIYLLRRRCNWILLETIWQTLLQLFLEIERHLERKIGHIERKALAYWNEKYNNNKVSIRDGIVNENG